MYKLRTSTSGSFTDLSSYNCLWVAPFQHFRVWSLTSHVSPMFLFIKVLALLAVLGSPQTAARFLGSGRGLPLCGHPPGHDVLQWEERKQNRWRERYGVKPRGNQVWASRSPGPVETLRRCSISPARSYPHTCEILTLVTCKLVRGSGYPGSHWGMFLKVASASHVPKSQTPRRKTGGQWSLKWQFGFCFIFFLPYLFIWPCWVLVVACKLLVVACGI